MLSFLDFFWSTSRYCFFIIILFFFFSCQKIANIEKKFRAFGYSFLDYLVIVFVTGIIGRNPWFFLLDKEYMLSLLGFLFQPRYGLFWLFLVKEILKTENEKLGAYLVMVIL